MDQKSDELAQISALVAQEVEKRVAAWLTAAYSIDFVNELKNLVKLNHDLRCKIDELKNRLHTAKILIPDTVGKECRDCSTNWSGNIWKCPSCGKEIL